MSAFDASEAPTKPFFTNLLGSRPMRRHSITIRKRVAEDAPTISPPPIENEPPPQHDDVPKFVPKGTPVIIMPPDLGETRRVG